MHENLDTGLRHRLRRALRRIEAQHSQLRPLLAEIEDGLRRGARAGLAPELARCHDALKAHFDLEDEMLFPALHGLSPAATAAIERLSREHGRFLAELRGMAEGADRLEVDAFSRLHALLGEHEQREEQLLQSILGQEFLHGA